MLNTIDWLIIVAYLTLVVTVGVVGRGRQQNQRDYFIGRGLFRGPLGSLLVGLSIAATFFSGITFLAYPSVVFRGGTVILAGLPVFFICWLVLRYVFLPRYMAGNWSQPYQLLEDHYGRATRRMAASLYVAVRIAWMAALIYAPTIALMAAADLGDAWFWPIVITIGLSSTLYTSLGGIRSVIITDAMQLVMIVIALAVTVWFVVTKIPATGSDVIKSLNDSGHLAAWDTSWSLTKPLTVWAVLIGMTVSSLGSYLGDQMSLQRYLTSNTVKEVNRSFLINIVGVYIVLLLLAAIGLLLAAWYAFNPDPGLPTRGDQILPYFVAKETPRGVAGLFLAAILAATMSSMTSGINALSGSLNMDFRGKPVDDVTPATSLRRARLTSLAVGIATTASAGLVAHLGELFDIAQRLLGLFLAPLAVAMLIAVLRVPLKRSSLVWGMMAGCAGGGIFALSEHVAKAWPAMPQVSSLWVAPIAAVITLMVSLIGLKKSSLEQTANAESVSVEPTPLEPEA